MSYVYGSDRSGRRKKNTAIPGSFILYGILFVVFFLILFVILVLYRDFTKERLQISQQREYYRKLYDNKNYLELIDKMDQALKSNPLKVDFLVYRGFSYYLSGENEKDTNKRMLYFDSAILDLRKALAAGVPSDMISDVYFCVGKIYYYYGRSYYKQSIAYLNKAITLGNERVDLLYVLGLVYANIGMYDESIKVLNKSLSLDESDIVSMAIALNYFRLEKFDEALNYIEKTLNIGKDIKITESALLKKAEILMLRNKYEDALAALDKIISLNENNAEAFYLRGEIYAVYTRDVVKARAEWRKALSINPSFIKAYRRL